MQDSSDQTTHQLQQEIKKLKKTLAQKDKELDIERRLWKNRAADWDPGDSTDLHRIEVFDGIISDESSLYSATLKTKEKFQHILEHAEVVCVHVVWENFLIQARIWHILRTFLTFLGTT